MTYHFELIENCNMCGAHSSSFKLIGKRLNSSQGLRPNKKSGIATSVFRCTECDLIFSNPLPIPNDIQDHYNVDPETYWKESYFDIDEYYFKSEIEWLNKLMPIEKNMKALDIGAGLGKAMIALEKHGFAVHGIEPSKAFYERAISRMNINSERLQNCQVEDANFENNFFDFITFGAVLEHLYDPNESLVRALKWLKPNGLIQIEVPNAHWLTNKLMNAYYKISGSGYCANISPMHEPFHLYEFSKNSFEKHGSINNYKIADSDFYLGDTFLPSILTPLLNPIMKMNNSGLQLVVWLKKNLNE